MGRRSSRGRLGARVDAAFDTVGLTILPGVDMPEWAQAMADEPAPTVHRPIADQEPSTQQPEPAGSGDLAEQREVPGQWATEYVAAGQAPGVQAMAGAGALVGAAAGIRTAPPGLPDAGADPTMPGMPPAAGDASTAQPWTSGHEAANGNGPGHQEFSEEQVALLSWWADTIASGNHPPVPAAPGANAQSAARARRRIPPWALIAVGLALIALAAGLVRGPKLWGAAAQAPVEPERTVSAPSTVEGLVAITDAAVADEMRPLIGFGLRPSGLIVTRPYGVDEAGPVSLATMATAMGAPGDTASQIEAWAERTGSAVDEAVAGSGATADVTCAAAMGTETVPTGAFCVWTGAGELRGQTYAVDVSAKKALQLTAAVRSGTSL